MSLDLLPIELIFLGTIILVLISIDGGYRLGRRVQRKHIEEKESAVSNMSGVVLGLLAFILAFTFGIVTGRYDTRRTLVLEEANAIQTTYSRTDFLPDSDRVLATELLKKYVDIRLAVVQMSDMADIQESLKEAFQIQQQLWDMAVMHGRKDMNSDVAALYIESLNDMINLQSSRVAVGMHARIPFTIWIMLFIFIALGVFTIGYMIAIAGSKRTLISIILAISFSLVITMIATLDRPINRYIKVSQMPMELLKTSMAADEIVY